MKTRAAVLRKAGTPWEITELELDPPKANEVLIQMEAAGLCHSDEHIRSRGMARLPLVGGHEGAGVVMETGPGVTRVKVGDRVSCSYIPVCGKCRYCSTGKQNLCDAGKWAGVGMNAVQGAAWAGAKHVFAIDPNEWKQQQALQFGATHAFGDPVKAKDVLIDLTRGQLADTTTTWSRPPWT
ncbi:MAG TPA: alcohol dehydrogenase catalytic domain-containing protein [Trebonia sp.]|jgi:Zn-dependent alcohol dehydrogenase|nr:alcohol dehydrogenase catalytic domain-containing protein [Trebonia sp.]